MNFEFSRQKEPRHKILSFLLENLDVENVAKIFFMNECEVCLSID